MYVRTDEYFAHAFTSTNQMRRTRRRALAVFASLALGASVAQAQGLSGTWQGTLREGPRPLRMKFRVVRTAAGSLSTTLWSLDEGNAGGFDPSYLADTAAVSGNAVLITLTPYRVRY